MINRKLSLILLLLSFFIIIGSVSAAEDTINNTSTSIEDNSVDVDCIDQKNAVELNDVQTTNNNLSDVDNLDVACNSVNNTGEITVNHNISSAKDLEGALNAGGNYMLIKNITISDMKKSAGSEVYINGNGYTIHGDDDKYCDIDVEKSSVCFVNCVFDKIRIDASSDVSLYNCTIQNTRTGIYRACAAIYAEKCNLVVDNCTIVNCGSEDDHRGPVWLDSACANITNTCFKKCCGVPPEDYECTGAISSLDTVLRLDNCIFEECYTSQYGGALYTNGGNTSIFNCSFTDCRAGIKWSEDFCGGAICADGPISIINCNFTNCSAPNYRDSFWKGAIDRFNFNFDFNVINCFINGVYWNSSLIRDADDLNLALNLGGNYTLANDIITGMDLGENYVVVVEGECIRDLINSGKNVCINGNGYTIRGADSKYCDIDVEWNCACFVNCVFDKIRIDASKHVSCYNCTIQNTRTGYYRDAAAIRAEGCKLIMDSCSIVNCGSNDGYHGAVYLRNCHANITNTCFKNCFGAHSRILSDDEGGAIYSVDTKLDLSSCVFEKCHTSDNGGAVYTFDGNSRIFNCSFIGCHADSSSYGGAIYMRGPTAIIDCNFTNCSATNYRNHFWKGAIDCNNFDTDFNISNCFIDGENCNISFIRTADDFKVALNNGGNYMLITNITISGVSKSSGKNVCINGNGYTIRGNNDKYCDIDIGVKSACFVNCVFDKVRIVASSDVSCYNCTIQNTGAGMWRCGAAISAEGCNLIMDNCSIVNCGSNTGYHGAVYLKNCHANITNTCFENCFGANSWSWNNEGGAIYSKDTKLDLSSCIFKNCCACDDGGAVYTYGGNSRIFNCSFSGCYVYFSSSYGGAIYAGGPADIIDCNFINCSATKCKKSVWKGAIDSDIDINVINCFINGGYHNSSLIPHVSDFKNALKS